MGHGKLRKFAENETFSCLLQPSAADVLVKEGGSRELVLRDHPVKGCWSEKFFGGSGGDIVLGAATVILAMGEGRRAAASINEYLAGK